MTAEQAKARGSFQKEASKSKGLLRVGHDVGTQEEIGVFTYWSQARGQPSGPSCPKKNEDEKIDEDEEQKDHDT